MRTELFDYELPKDLIAAAPVERRDESRLMVLDRGAGSVTHRVFRDLPGLLRAGDLLVVNDSRVFRARLHGKRLATGGHVEFLLLERATTVPNTPAAGDRWVVMCRPAKKLKPGERVYFGNKRLEAVVVSYVTEGERVVEFSVPDVLAMLDDLGEIPLPPYIVQRRRDLHEPEVQPGDAERYQTVYAREPGSVAAPTAGLHFTAELLDVIRAGGVETTAVTLHVGPGTFRPVEAETIEEHRMHSEHFEIGEGAADAVNHAKREGRRVVAVGTTVVRSLESAANPDGTLRAGRHDTALMIAPGYDFRVVDALITNFHLPRSTLLMLVSAFAGREFILDAYREAVESRYRFFSYGDAMFLV